jgi:hypothetical protein
MMKDKFLISALAAVTTAGTIGVAIAQNVQPNQGAQGNTQATLDQGTGNNASTQTPMAQSNTTGSTSADTSSSSASASSSAPADTTMAQADRG